MPPAPSPGLEVQAPVRNIFPFNQKPNTLDRDHILVPAGWDSWGKIGVLRDGFDAKLWNEAWERDLEADGSSNEPGAKAVYSSFVPDMGPKVRHSNICPFPPNSPGFYSQPHSPRSIIPSPSKPSLPGTTTKTRRKPTETLVEHSRIPEKCLLVSSVLLGAAASACRTSRERYRRWSLAWGLLVYPLLPEVALASVHQL
jgi:hypothetical protein